ncbi:MAG: extracellular solute-binding protein [Caldilineaceae bacterium]|nr:extracellular solute-binding protein [Caldilineaceae bacterium]
MQNNRMSRRSLLKWMGVSSAAVALAACAPAAAPDTAATSSEGAAPSVGAIDMSVATFAAELHDWQREFSKRWAEENPDVNLSIEEIVYNEMAKLQLARSASGTLWDLTFSGIKWFPFSASKEMFLPLDDWLASRDDANLDDFFETAIAGGALDGTLYGLPYEIHPGNPALIAFNVDYLEEKGLPLPTDDWDVFQYADLAAQATDAENNIFGTNYLPGNYYDFQSLSRAYGTDLFDAERKQFLFNTDETNREAAQWIVDLRTKLGAAPMRDETEGLQFASGTLATQVTGSYSVNGFATAIGDSFNHDWALFPKGPNGDRGYTAFTSNYSCSSQSVDPEKAVDLLLYLTSTEAGTWSALEQGTGQPNARRSVWENEDLLNQSHDIFRRVLAMYNDPDIPGPFPMPFNLRFQEFQDNWANTSPDLFYGDLAFEEGMQTVQDACQEILDLPRA